MLIVYAPAVVLVWVPLLAHGVEPTIDYVVTKIPRFTFEKFPGTEPLLTTSMIV